MSSMQAYLAEKYMTGPKADAILSHTAPKKKKKRKPDTGPTTGGGAMIVDDDDPGWGAAPNLTGVDEDEDAEEAVVASDRSFKKRRMEPGEGGGSGWTTVREPTPPPAADEQPVVVATTEEAEPFRGGLLTKNQIRAKFSSSRDARLEEEDDPEAVAAAQETVYRDASGRKIDMKLERAEAARKKREREELEAQKMQWGKGMVQREEAEKRKREEDRIRQSGFTRYVDDEDLNQAQKEQERWNDPAAAFMTKKRTKGPRKPEYTGPPPPPNRFGIKPGYRWDGVDRGNGFEKKCFQKQNARRRTGQQSHDWSVEDM
ncbi:Pre-mRNA-splicing factor of RES complex-domain-containing protein [Russula aff. rugulosa BPL654]|nr:Pre-mRNA-splicing factor of RES complex-domain-containing protein [Russula aff. rugulosa BPL654]